MNAGKIWSNTLPCIHDVICWKNLDFDNSLTLAFKSTDRKQLVPKYELQISNKWQICKFPGLPNCSEVIRQVVKNYRKISFYILAFVGLFLVFGYGPSEVRVWSHQIFSNYQFHPRNLPQINTFHFFRHQIPIFHCNIWVIWLDEQWPSSMRYSKARTQYSLKFRIGTYFMALNIILIGQNSSAKNNRS